MSPHTRDVKKHAKARQRRRRTAQERMARDCRQAQHAAEALQQALDDLGLPEDLVAEIEGRLCSQRKLLGKIVGVMSPEQPTRLRVLGGASPPAVNYPFGRLAYPMHRKVTTCVLLGRKRHSCPVWNTAVGATWVAANLEA